MAPKITIDHDPGSDDLDTLLDASGPSVSPITPAVSTELGRMTREARVATPSRSTPRLSRSAFSAAIAFLLVGGAGAAAAATADEWAPWAQQPDDAYSYTLPSGARCEGRIGNIQGKDGMVEPVAAAIRGYLDEVDILEVADIDAALADVRSSESVQIMPDGSQQDAGPGSESYSADLEYSRAVSQAIHTALEKEMRRQGIDLSAPGLNLSFDGELHCPGAQW